MSRPHIATEINVLPDVLGAKLKVVFCGTTTGVASVRAGAYYAGPGNRSWDILYEVNFTPYLLKPLEFNWLPKHRIASTDIVKSTVGSDANLSEHDFISDRLRINMAKYAPRVLAFKGIP